jgi:diguanylate cyclase (GGDEF)-like protein
MAGKSVADQSPRAVTGNHRRRSLATTAALAGVLAALSAYTVIGTVHMTQAVKRHSQSLTVDAWFGEAGAAIAVQEMENRHYQAQPSVSVRTRERAAADMARKSLERIVAVAPSRDAATARRLLAAWVTYQGFAEKLMAMVADEDPEAIGYDRLEATPAYFTLKQDIDVVVVAYHAYVQRETDTLRKDQINLLVGTSIGYGAGLILVTFISRMMLSDQGKLAKHADEYQHRSLHDVLTNLPNRAMFHRQLEAQRKSHESDGHIFGVLLLDLDGFKKVNDTLGHAAGDQLLVQSGRRLASCVRSGDLVARLGGDEFAMLLPNLRNVSEALLVGDRIVTALRQEFLLDAGPVLISGSLGVAISPLHGTGDELVSNADAAMYRAKSNGGGVTLFDRNIIRKPQTGPHSGDSAEYAQPESRANAE